MNTTDIRSATKPRMLTTYTEKVKDDYQYCKDFIQYCINTSNSTDHSSGGNDEEGYDVLYKLWDGILPKKWFDKVTNPYNSKNEDNKRFPAHIEFYNLLYTNLVYLLGKKIERGTDYTIVNRAADANFTKTKELEKLVKGNLQQLYINTINQYTQSGRDSEDVPPLESVIKDFEETYQDKRAKDGNLLLKYLKSINYMDESLLESFKDHLLVKGVVNHLDIRNGELTVNRVPIKEISYGKVPNSQWIQDADWVVRKMRMTFSEILDEFWDMIPEESLKELDEKSTSSAAPYFWVFQNYYTKKEFQEMERNVTKVTVYHVQFRTTVMYKIHGSVGLDGEMVYTEVDETFTLTPFERSKGHTLESKRRNEVWEGYQLDGKIWLGIRPLPYQSNELDNKGESKLSYVGRFGDGISIGKLGLVWQKLWIILWYRLEMAIAKSKGNIVFMPIQALPNGEGKQGIGMDEFLYYSESLGIGFIDMEQDGMDKISGVNNAIQSVSMTQLSEIKNYVDLLEYVKNKWDEQVGITDASKGQQLSSQGVGSVRAEINSSSVITELIFTEFNQFEMRLYQAMLDYSRFVYKDGLKRAVLIDDTTQAYLDAEPDDIMSMDVGVFATNTINDMVKMEKLQEAAVTLASQSVSPLAIAEAINANTAAEAVAVLRKIEEKGAKSAQAEQQAEQSTAEFEHKLTMELEQFKLQGEMELEKMKQDGKLKELQLSLAYKGDGSLDVTKTTDNAVSNLDSYLAKKGSDLEERKIANEENKTALESRDKLLEISQRESDSKRKASTALKNKVVGEK